MRNLSICITFLLLLSSCTENYSDISTPPKTILDEKAELGAKLFFENKLSNPEGQSCSSCHSPQAGFSDPNHNIVTQGIIPNLFGNRNAPSLAYAVFAPERYYNSIDATYIGGMFLDGRSTNLETQILGPLLNPVEMNNTSKAMIANKIRSLDYFTDFTRLYGNAQNDNELIAQLTNAISLFEKSRTFNSFTSKFDYYSKGTVSFTSDERAGLALYVGKANCASCHPIDEDENTGKVLFTDFSYDNLGVPKNPRNPFYNMASSINPDGINYIDTGIGSIVNQPEHKGKFKVPTLRNVAVSAPYFHNGVFNTLEEVIHFYNKRDVENLWVPEYPLNVNRVELGNLKMSANEERQLKIFLETLTDHYRK